MLIDSPFIIAHAMLMQCNDTEELAKRNWLFSRRSINANLPFFFATFNQPRYVSLIVLDENSEFLFGQSTKQDRGTKIHLGGYILRCSFNVLRRAYDAQLGLESANFSSQTIFVTHRGVQYTVYSKVCRQTDKPEKKWWFFVTHKHTPNHWDCLRKCLFFVPNTHFSSLTGVPNWPSGYSLRKCSFFVPNTHFSSLTGVPNWPSGYTAW